MKPFKSSFVLLLFFLIAQPTRADIFDEVVKILESGNTEKLHAYFSPNIDLELPDGTMHLSNGPALKKALASFVSENPAKSVAIKHRGPLGKQSFVVANYITKSGETYRLTIFMEGNAENMRIRELKFENS